MALTEPWVDIGLECPLPGGWSIKKEVIPLCLTGLVSLGKRLSLLQLVLIELPL